MTTQYAISFKLPANAIKLLFCSINMYSEFLLIEFLPFIAEILLQVINIVFLYLLQPQRQLHCAFHLGA
jgi:hypothetical protein